MRDVAGAARAFGTREGDDRWNPLADVNGNGYADILDIALVAKDLWKR